MSVRAVTGWRFMRHLYTTPFCAIRIDSAFVAATHSNSRSWQQQQELKLLLELQLQLQFPEKSYRAACECESERDDSIAANYSKINTRLICKSCIHFWASILCSGSLALCGLLCVCVHAVCLSESFMVFNLPSDVRPTRTTRTTTLRATCQCHRSARVHSQRQRVRGNHGHFIFLSIFPPPFPFAVCVCPTVSPTLANTAHAELHLIQWPPLLLLAYVQWPTAARYHHYYDQH